MKNRISDVLPYDHNRIELPTTKDDYINASMITSLSPSGNTSTPSFIATQAPLSCSLQDFWTMIWQQGVEIVVCLLSDAEISPKNNGLVYWPTGRLLVASETFHAPALGLLVDWALWRVNWGLR